jgi:hypothetical protein
MFHEVAYGLGNQEHDRRQGSGPQRAQGKKRQARWKKRKAGHPRPYMIRQLNARGDLGKGIHRGHHITFVASLFRLDALRRSRRARPANVVAFNFSGKSGAFTREASGASRTSRRCAAADELSRRILVPLQGNGDYAGVGQLSAEFGNDRRADASRPGPAGRPRGSIPGGIS